MLPFNPICILTPQDKFFVSLTERGDTAGDVEVSLGMGDARGGGGVNGKYFEAYQCPSSFLLIPLFSAHFLVLSIRRSVYTYIYIYLYIYALDDVYVTFPFTSH